MEIGQDCHCLGSGWTSVDCDHWGFLHQLFFLSFVSFLPPAGFWVLFFNFKLSLTQPMIFFIFSLPVLSPSPHRWSGESVSDCVVFTCLSSLNHDASEVTSMTQKKWSKKRYWLKASNMSILHSIMLNLASKSLSTESGRGSWVWWVSGLISIDLQRCIGFLIPINTYKVQECKKLPPESSKWETESPCLIFLPSRMNSSSSRLILLFQQAANKDQIYSGSVIIYSHNNWQRRLAAFVAFQQVMCVLGIYQSLTNLSLLPLAAALLMSPHFCFHPPAACGSMKLARGARNRIWKG